MEALIILLILFLAFVVFIFPIWTFIRIRGQQDELDRLRRQVDQLEEDLRRRPAAPPPESAASAAAKPPTETSVTAAAPVPPTPPVVPPPLAPSTPVRPAAPVALPSPQPGEARPAPAAPAVPPLSAPALASAAAPEATPPPLPLTTPPRAATPPSAPKKPAINWEQFMGVKLFLWLGGFALFLGAVFFVKLSIEQGWIPPEVRVALGFLLGAGLVVGGVALSRKRYAVQAQTLCATGIVTLYAITFACRSIYHFSFFGPGATLALMVLITTTAFLLAVRLNAVVVALLGMLGGFLTPMLLSTGQDNPLGLFTYIALLDIGLLGVALRRRWLFLVPLAALGTGVMQVGWASEFLTSEKTGTAMIVCLTFVALFLASCAVARRFGKLSRALSYSVAGLALLSFAFAWHLALNTPAGLQPVRWLGFVFVVDLGLLALALIDVSTAKLHALGGAAVFSLLAAWTYDRMNAGILPAALTAYLIYAALHSAFPLLLIKLRPEAKPGRWHQLFTPLAMILILGPVLNSPYASFAVWPAILLLDLLAIALAWFTASAAVVVAVLILTLIAAGQSIFHLPTSSAGGSLLLLVAGFAVLFFVAGLLLNRRGFARLTKTGEADELASFSSHLPALSALLPFVLLIMATGRLSLTDPTPVFGLSLLLVILSLGLAYFLENGALPLCALSGTLALAYTWHIEHFSPQAAGEPLLWFLVFYGVFTAFPFIFHRKLAELRGPWIASAAAGPLVFPLVFAAVKRGWPNDIMGLLPLAFALPAIGCVIALLKLDPVGHPRRLGRLALFGGVALLFITLIFPIQFDRQWITIAWALEGVAVLWLFHRVPHRGLPIAGVLLLIVAFVRLALNPAVLSYHAHDNARILNWYLYAYGTTVVCLLAGARLLAPPRERVLGLNAPPWLQTLAGLLLFLLVNIEIADYFSHGSYTLTFEFSGNFARDMSYTIAWALFAFALLIVGIWKRARGARYAALALLGLTVLKLFLHDLAQLPQLYRIGAFMGVAVISILASFLYQRFLTPDEKDPVAKS